MTNGTIRPKIRRRHYLILKKFQLKYIGLLLFLMFMTGILSSYVIYYTTMMVIGEKLANVYPQGRLISVLNIYNFRILFSIILVTPLVILIGIFVSHKIAGPMYRMEKFLRNMASGDLTERLILRKGDELTLLADAINYLRDILRASFNSQKQVSERMSYEVENLKAVSGQTPQDVSRVREFIDKLDASMKDIEKELEKYRLEKKLS